MIAGALIAGPLVAALVIVVVGSRHAFGLLATAGALCAGAAAVMALWPPVDGPWLAPDDTARLFAALIDGIFFGVAVYAWSRVRVGGPLAAALGPPRRFAALTLVFLAACNTVLLADDLMILWLALETSTIAIAPLVARADVPASRLASWRYFLFSLVGLGIVLAGLGCLARGMDLAGHAPSLSLSTLGVVAAPADPWTLLGVGLVVLGLGTKLGLAPMYVWLPDAYEAAPSPVAALLGAVQFNAALVMLLRVVHAYRQACPDLISTELLLLGLASMAMSTASIIATRNFKRLLAYAAINHAGVIAVGLAIGGAASYGMVLYVVSNAFIKAILFLTAGKVEAHCGTRDAREIGGLIKDIPYSGVFLMVGTFALLGFPPFGSFLGELLVLSALVAADQLLVFAAMCTLATMSFVAVGRTVFPMIWGEPKLPRSPLPLSRLSLAPKLAFLGALVLLGVYIPSVVNELLARVALTVGGP